MTNTKPDPGGHFASDYHRRVLGHLSLPGDTYGWTSDALLVRCDVPGELQEAILADLEEAGYAEQPTSGVWRMTKPGLEVLQLGVSTVGEEGPALITTSPSRGAATAISAGA